MNKKCMGNEQERNEQSKGNRKSVFTTPPKKSSPQKVGPVHLLPPVLITSGSEPTLFTAPLLIASPHYIDIS